MSIDEAAKELNLSPKRVREHCRAGRLKAQKVGHSWIITRRNLEAFKALDRPVGRPPKCK